METQIEQAFLIYANYPLKEYPEKLGEMFRVIENQRICLFEGEVKGVRCLEESFVNLIQAESREAAERIRENYCYDFERRCVDIAFSDVYPDSEEHEEWCERFCDSREKKEERLGKEIFTGPSRLRCFECDQLFFKKGLYDIVAGKKWSKMSSHFGQLMQDAYSHFSYRVYCTSENPDSEEKLEKDVFFSPWGYLENTEIEGSFSKHIVIPIISFSLAEFLLHNDRRKLKICDACGRFFVASKLDSRIKKCAVCSPKSTMSKEERRLYQQKWRKDKRAKEKKQRFEEQVKRMMDAGFTRTQALKEMNKPEMKKLLLKSKAEWEV